MTTRSTAAPAAPLEVGPLGGTTTGPHPGASSAAASRGRGDRFSALSDRARASVEGTPGRMRLLAAAGVAVALVFALAAGQAFRATDSALTRASANTQQLVRVQGIQTRLVEADATATNAFLVGGLESPAQRDQYQSAISSASQLIAQAAQHQPADGHALGALNDAVVAYASEIERARADNRIALPVGAQYLRDASAHLRSDALPILTNLVDANDRRVVAEFDNAHLAVLWLLLSGLVAVGVFVLELVWLARRTRRYVNVPLAAGAMLVLVTLALGMIGLTAVAATVSSVRAGDYAATLSTAKARISGFDAKSNESLTLIARGSGQPFEKAWTASAAMVKNEMADLNRNGASSGAPTLPWAAYEAVHTDIRKLDDTGNWDQAVAKATSTKPDGGNGSFARFDTASAGQLATFSTRTVSRLDGAAGWLPVAGALGVLAGLAAAGLAWYGFSLRLEEYR